MSWELPKRPKTVLHHGVRFRTTSEYAVSIPSLGHRTAVHRDGLLTFDDRAYIVEQLHPGGLLVLYPRAGAGRTPLTDAAFYAHCLSYEHDAPAVVVPREGAGVEPRAPGPGRRSRSMTELAVDVAELVHGAKMDHGSFEFRLPRRGTDFPFRRMYAGKNAERVAMYSLAVRQGEPLSEFLHYFRVLESIDGKNGMTWIERNIPRLSRHAFGHLTHVDLGGANRMNLLQLYKRRAVAQAKSLRKKLGTDKAVSEHLYKVTRCGIAHGKTGIITFDFDRQLEKMDRDVVLAKMLARLAIDDSVPTEARRMA